MYCVENCDFAIIVIINSIRCKRCVLCCYSVIIHHRLSYNCINSVLNSEKFSEYHLKMDFGSADIRLHNAKLKTQISQIQAVELKSILSGLKSI